MKKLEKNEMKLVKGGQRADEFKQGCWDNGDGTSSCNIVYGDGKNCHGVYTYGGATISLECWYNN
ncbi:MAG: hypothetical protein HY951_04515 [Bacteroidia bacterium]|nr:hypothetical protein [Bacteroidia bacterium]